MKAEELSFKSAPKGASPIMILESEQSTVIELNRVSSKRRVQMARKSSKKKVELLGPHAHCRHYEQNDNDNSGGLDK